MLFTIHIRLGRDRQPFYLVQAEALTHHDRQVEELPLGA